MTALSRQGDTKNAVSWSTSYKTEFVSKELLLRFISSFQHVLVLIRAFRKYYGLSRDFLLTPAFDAFLSKFKIYFKVIESNFLYKISKNRYKRYFI